MKKTLKLYKQQRENQELFPIEELITRRRRSEVHIIEDPEMNKDKTIDNHNKGE